MYLLVVVVEDDFDRVRRADKQAIAISKACLFGTYPHNILSSTIIYLHVP